MALSATRKAARKQKRVEAVIAAAEEARRQRAVTRLSEWEAEAKRRANSLEPGLLVWRLCDEFASEALDLGVYRELRWLCWEAAGRVADVRGLRVTRCHRRGREAEQEK